MEGHEQSRPAQVQPQIRFQLRPRQERRRADVVDGGRTGHEDPPRVLSQLAHAPGVDAVGGEMKMGELGDGVAQGVVEGAVGEFSAVQMGDGDRKRKGGQGRGVHLVAVAENHDEVRLQARVGAGKSRAGRPHRAGDPFGRVGGGDLDSRGGLPPVGENLPDGQPLGAL